MGGGRRKKLAIKIRPASEASTAPALAANKDISAVVASLRGSIEGLPAASSGPERPDPAQDSATRFQQGMASLQHGRWQDAILELDSALALMASDMAALDAAAAKLAPLVEKAGFPEKDINTGLKMFDS